MTIRDLTPQEEQERLRAEFQGMVSHELRTPPTSIRRAEVDRRGYHLQPVMPESSKNLLSISDCLPQFPSQNRSSNFALVLQELTLPRICPKYVEARLRAGESAGPRYSSTYLDCPVESWTGHITATIE